MLLIVVLSLFVCGIVNAANVTGVWQGALGYVVVQMTLKQTGKKIKGSMVDIEEGEYQWSVKGNITGNEIRLIFTGITYDSNDGDYTGTVEGDIIDLDTIDLGTTRLGRIYECKEVK